jgi:hypothetical protein
MARHSGRRFWAGAVAGLIGGLVVDGLMRLWPTSTPDGDRISMIGFASRAVHASHPWIGWVVYPVYAVALGILFTAFLRHRIPADAAGLSGGLYGFCWWFMANLVLVPALFGEVPLSASAMAMTQGPSLPLLAGHLVYGAILGVVFNRLS